MTEWKARLARLLEELAALDLGYPAGESRLGPPAGQAELDALADAVALREAAPLCAFYRVCAEVQLPDVHNGYFILPPRLVFRGWQTGEPRRLSGPYARDILSIGGDGGGGRFALDRDGGGEVLHLGAGSVRDGLFDGGEREGHRLVTVLAPDLPAFLDRMLADVDAFLRDDRDWPYMV